MEGLLTPGEIAKFVQAHNRAIDEYKGRDYKIWCDLSKMEPLSPGCTTLLEKAKQYSSSRKNFRGSAVLVTSAIVAMQNRRTSIDGGISSTELVSEDVIALRAHLKSVHRE